MMKFFRKYNRQLLALFMALLMVVFIGGSALRNLMTPNQNRVVATSALGDIDYVDQQAATASTQLLDSINMNWRHPLGGSHPPLEPIDWILVTREAAKLGNPVDPAAVRASMSTEVLDNFARQLRIKPVHLLQAMAELRAVTQAAHTMGVASTPSEAAIQSAAKESLETTKINALMLPAKAFLDSSMVFSDAELQEQYEKFKTKESGDGMNFGYYRDPAIKVQFIAIHRE